MVKINRLERLEMIADMRQSAESAFAPPSVSKRIFRAIELIEQQQAQIEGLVGWQWKVAQGEKGRGE